MSFTPEELEILNSSKMTWVHFPKATLDVVGYLPDENAGELIKAIAHYIETGEEPMSIKDPHTMTVFFQFRKTYDKSARETIAKIRRSKANGEKGNPPRPVQHISENGVVYKTYSSVSEASRELGIDKGNISRVCKGEIQQTNGYIFRYAN